VTERERERERESVGRGIGEARVFWLKGEKKQAELHQTLQKKEEDSEQFCFLVIS